MKKFTNILAVISAVALVIPVFNGCKKGPEDPFLSLRSRNKRIEGTWTLKKVDYAYTEDKKETRSNSVNSANYTKTDNTTYTITYDGSNMITKETTTSNTTDNKKQYNGTSFADNNSTTVSNSSESWTKSYTITVSIYKDNTYEYTVTEKAAGYSYSSSTTINGGTPITSSESCGGTQSGVGGTCYTADEQTITQYGTWVWADELGKSSKGKIEINAGPLSGYLARLSNKGLIIDYTYQGVIFGAGNPFNSGNFSSNAKNDNEVETLVSDTIPFSTYNNSSPFETQNGTQTITTTTTTKIVSGKSTWEKTDKKRKRKEGEKEE